VDISAEYQLISFTSLYLVFCLNIRKELESVLNIFPSLSVSYWCYYNEGLKRVLEYAYFYALTRMS